MKNTDKEFIEHTECKLSFLLEQLEQQAKEIKQALALTSEMKSKQTLTDADNDLLLKACSMKMTFNHHCNELKEVIKVCSETN